MNDETGCHQSSTTQQELADCYVENGAIFVLGLLIVTIILMKTTK